MIEITKKLYPIEVCQVSFSPKIAFSFLESLQVFLPGVFSGSVIFSISRTGIFMTVFYLKERGLQTWQIDVRKIRFLLHFNFPILVNIL